MDFLNMDQKIKVLELAVNGQKDPNEKYEERFKKMKALIQNEKEGDKQ